jgi:hypothetical protein
MISTRAFLTPLAAIVALVTCSGGDGGGTQANPTPGTLLVGLTSATSEDGAILVTLQGGKMGGLQAARGAIRWSASGDSTQIKVVLIGSLATGDLLRFDVPDIAKVGNYSATTTQVAGRSNSYALLQTADFDLSVAAAP